MLGKCRCDEIMRDMRFGAGSMGGAGIEIEGQAGGFMTSNPVRGLSSARG